MNYKITLSKDRQEYWVVNEDTGEILGEYTQKSGAAAHIVRLYKEKHDKPLTDFDRELQATL